LHGSPTLDVSAPRRSRGARSSIASAASRPPARGPATVSGSCGSPPGLVRRGLRVLLVSLLRSRSGRRRRAPTVHRGAPRA
jgi:hypothetical protein